MKKVVVEIEQVGIDEVYVGDIRDYWGG